MSIRGADDVCHVLVLGPTGASYELSTPAGSPDTFTWRAEATFHPRVELDQNAARLIHPVFCPDFQDNRATFDRTIGPIWIDHSDRYWPDFALVRQWWTHLRAFLDPALALATAPFHWHVRGFVYECLANDPTGRVAQLAHTCPGLLILLAHPCAEDIRAATLARVIAGDPLPHVIRAAVAAVHTPASAPWQTEARCLRVARAVPSLNCALLPDIEHLPLVPDDIPRDPRARELWFDWQWTAGDLTHVPEPVVHGFATFASRHYATLEELIRERGPDRDARDAAVHHLLDYIRGTSRVLTRRTSPARVLEAADAWHAREQWGTAHRPETRLPAEPWACHGRWRQGPDEIVPLRTIADLHAESRQMHHCVITHATPALAGDVALFHAEILGSPLTLEISAGPHGIPTLTEASGVSNARPGAHQLAVIADWLDDLRAIHDGRRPKRGRFIKDAAREEAIRRREP